MEIVKLLEAEDIEFLVVNAQHMKAVPGRKTDVKDAEWIAKLLRRGLLKASYILDRNQRELRELVRYRRSIIEERARQHNRIQKVLEGANIKLGSVVSDVQGVSARDMLDAIADGEEDPEKLANLTLKQFFEDLKNSGLDKNTMVVMYGDYYGISENRKNAMSKVLNRDINNFEQAQLQRVPLFIYAPGLKGFVSETFGGEVDVRPTVLNLLGVDTTHQVAF